MFCLAVVFTFLGSYPAFAVLPIVDCNNNVFCQNQESWEEYNSLAYKKGNCIVNPRFRINKCCVGASCSYIIDLVSVTVVGTCTEPMSEIKKDALKFIFSKLPELANAPHFTNFNVHVKIPKCMTDEQRPWFNYILRESYACEPNDCCLMVYNVAALGYYGVRIINQYPDQNMQITCTGTSGVCAYSCDDIDFTPDLPFDINFNDFSGELCELDCFWKLDGNDNVTNQNFIGPTNGEDFVVKTFSTSQSLLTERIRVSSNSAIDFKFNSWFTMPQISFDSPLFGNDFYGDPLIKYYRPTGDPEVNGLYPAYPWWIGVNVATGLPTEAQASFNIFSGPSSLPGEENQNMIRRLTILRNGNVGIGVLNPAVKLAVAGTICAEEVRVSLSGAPCWPDYVFADNYNLTTINDLEKFIKSNKHLPGIPNAEEVANNGIELGDMQARMLQKIEELTLYIIELKKENEEIKKMVNTKKE